MLLVLLSGGRRTHECASQLNECTWRSVFGGVALLTTLCFSFVYPGSPTVNFVEWRLMDSTSRSVSGGVVSTTRCSLHTKTDRLKDFTLLGLQYSTVTGTVTGNR